MLTSEQHRDFNTRLVNVTLLIGDRLNEFRAGGGVDLEWERDYKELQRGVRRRLER